MSNPLDNLKKYDIVLASGSPRRRELLAALDVEFAVEVKQGIDESYPADMAPDEVPLFLSAQMARAYMATATARQLVITADTVVITSGRIMGKPHSESEAFSMLRRLSGRDHQVMSGLTVLHGDDCENLTVTTTLRMRTLSDEEIRAYIATGEPMDKAGAYGIQGRGALFVAHLDGDYFNVMGLPLCRLGQLLNELGVELL